MFLAAAVFLLAFFFGHSYEEAKWAYGATCSKKEQVQSGCYGLMLSGLVRMFIDCAGLMAEDGVLIEYAGLG